MFGFSIGSEGERWTLLDGGLAMVVHPNRPPKIVCPDGRVEEIASKADAKLSKLAMPRRRGFAELLRQTVAGNRFIRETAE